MHMRHNRYYVYCLDLSTTGFYSCRIFFTLLRVVWVNAIPSDETAAEAALEQLISDQSLSVNVYRIKGPQHMLCIGEFVKDLKNKT